MSKQRKKGSAFEVLVMNHLRDHQPREVERVALHGNRDEGDLLIMGTPKICVECKNVAGYGPALLHSWQDQTQVERGNSDASIGLLVVHREGCGPKSADHNDVWMTLADMVTLAQNVQDWDDIWVHVTLGDVEAMLSGETGKDQQ